MPRSKFQIQPPAPEAVSGPSLIAQIEGGINTMGDHIEEQDGNIAAIEQTANSALATATDALNTAQSAVDTANDAKADADTAIGNAATAQAAADAAQATANTALNTASTAETLALDDINNITFSVDSSVNAVIANITRGNGNESTRNIPLASAPAFVPDPNYLGSYADEAALNALPEVTIANTEYLGLYANQTAIEAIAGMVAGNFADNQETGTEWIYNGTAWSDSTNPIGTTPHGTTTTGNDGMMPKESFEQIQQNTSDLEQLRGVSRRYVVHMGSATITDPAVLQAAYDAAAGVPTGTVPPDGTTLVNMDEAGGAGVAYSYYAAQGIWRNRGTDTVNQATNTTLGVVKGTPSNIVNGVEQNAGRVYVESGGSLSVLGWNDITNNSGVPSGFIGMWSGAVTAIPTGWLLCDGENGTPDLRDRFLVGAGNTYAAGDTGGADAVTPTGTVANTTLTIAKMPSHGHTYTATGVGTGAGLGTTSSPYPIVSNTANTGAAGGGGAHDHGLTLDAIDTRPPYYALAFIMKS